MLPHFFPASIPTTLPPAQIAREVADIIDFAPEIFDIEEWGNDDCTTPACIAGHIGRMHLMTTGLLDSFCNRYQNNIVHERSPISEWKYRQGARINLTNNAAEYLFTSAEFQRMPNPDIAKVLRELSKELEDRTELISSVELEKITARALTETG